MAHRVERADDSPETGGQRDRQDCPGQALWRQGRESIERVTGRLEHELTSSLDKMFAYLRRRGMLALGDEDDANEMAPLAASAVAGTTPPAGPEWRRGKLPLTHQAMKMGRPM